MDSMATALVNSPITTAPEAVDDRPSPNPVVVALATAAACIAVVWVATVVLLLVLTSSSTWGAVGVGAYAAFWLGGGFGAIFGSAAVFGKEH